MKVQAKSIVLLFAAVLSGFAANAFRAVSETDSVYVNGKPLRIVADIEVDSLKQREKEKWSEGAEWSMFTRVNALLNDRTFETVDYFRIVNNTHIPELGAEVIHSTEIHNQLYYKLGATIGLATKFHSDEVDSTAIGFELVDDELLQILVVPDDLQNETDTLPVPLSLVPQLKINVGFEWHGVMRKARGWRFGASAEWTPVRNQLSHLYKIPSDNPDDWDEIDFESTYSIESLKTSKLHLRLYAGWSPWSSNIFMRGAIVLSPNRIEGGLTLGYHL